MRNWTTTLRGASFRGAPFFVADEKQSEGGRNIAVHHFAKAEVHDTEDMGRKARKFTVRAYVAGDRADAMARALGGACSAPGPAMLVMPFLGALMARCEKIHIGHSSDRQGYAECELEFIEAGNGSAFPAMALGDRILDSLMDTLPGALLDGLAAAGGDLLSGVAETVSGGLSLIEAGETLTNSFLAARGVVSQVFPNA